MRVVAVLEGQSLEALVRDELREPVAELVDRVAASSSPST